MATNPKQTDDQAWRRPVYDGPIFDADSHIQERNFDFMAQYTPKKFHADWLVQSRYDENGEYSLFLATTRSTMSRSPTASCFRRASSRNG
jgi:hypothetical protein